jgi:hypothetical protein
VVSEQKGPPRASSQKYTTREIFIAGVPVLDLRLRLMGIRGG